MILHVEDDKDIRDIAKMALEMAGDFDVTQFDCCSAALAGAANLTPKVILLDVMMPDMSGPQTLVELRKFAHLKDIPVIYMTARVQPSDIIALKEDGALGVITKPFDPVTLAQQIKDLMGV